MSLSESEFKYIQDFIYQKSAIVLDADKGYLIESRLQPLARRRGFDSIDDMVARMRKEPMNGLHWSVVEAMTTNETYFFRDVLPFELLKKTVLPDILQRRAAVRELNIWCGAASSGQEPYTIAMVLRENFPQLVTWKINFIATDISKEMLDRCREGCYSQLEMNRGLPAPLLIKYFQKIGTEWQIKEDMRKMIQFKELNLAQSWPLLPSLDVVFLRNVLIYFNNETKKAIFAKIRKLLKPDGYLFLGGAETTMGIDDAFKRIAVDKGSCYQVTG